MAVIRHRCKTKSAPKRVYKYMVFETKKNGDPAGLHRFVNKTAAKTAAKTIQLEHKNQAVIRPYDEGGYTVMNHIGFK